MRMSLSKCMWMNPWKKAACEKEKEDWNKIGGKKRPDSDFKLLLRYLCNAIKLSSNCIFIAIDKEKMEEKCNKLCLILSCG